LSSNYNSERKKRLSAWADIDLR